MIKKLKINSVEYELKLNNEEFKLIKEFINLTDRLWEMVKDVNFNTNTSLNFSIDSDMKKETTLPKDKDIFAVLHCLRPLILQKERTYLPTVKNIIRKNIKDEKIKYFLKKLVENFKMIDASRIKFNDINLIDDNTFKEWLNAFEFHRDIEKQKSLNVVIEGMGSDFFKSQMMIITIFKMNAIFGFTTLLKEIIIEHTSVISFNDEGTSFKIFS